MQQEKLGGDVRVMGDLREEGQRRSGRVGVGAIAGERAGENGAINRAYADGCGGSPS